MIFLTLMLKKVAFKINKDCITYVFAFKDKQGHTLLKLEQQAKTDVNYKG